MYRINNRWHGQDMDINFIYRALPALAQNVQKMCSIHLKQRNNAALIV